MGTIYLAAKGGGFDTDPNLSRANQYQGDKCGSCQASLMFALLGAYDRFDGSKQAEVPIPKQARGCHKFSIRGKGRKLSFEEAAAALSSMQDALLDITDGDIYGKIAGGCKTDACDLGSGAEIVIYRDDTRILDALGRLASDKCLELSYSNGCVSFFRPLAGDGVLPDVVMADKEAIDASLTALNPYVADTFTGREIDIHQPSPAKAASRA